MRGSGWSCEDGGAASGAREAAGREGSTKLEQNRQQLCHWCTTLAAHRPRSSPLLYQPGPTGTSLRCLTCTPWMCGNCLCRTAMIVPSSHLGRGRGMQAGGEAQGSDAEGARMAQ